MALEIIHAGEVATYETILKDELDVVIPSASLTGLTLTFKDKKTAAGHYIRIGSLNGINAGADASLKITGDITIETRFNLQDPIFPNSAVNWNLGGNESFQTYGYLLRIDGASRKAYYRTNQAGAFQESLASNILSRNVWYHLILTRSGTTAKFYLDGVEISKDTSGSHINPTASLDLYIIGSALDGFLDFHKIYNRVLSASEILDRFQKNIDIQIGLISDWKFEGNFQDSKGSNHGTFSGTDIFKNFGIINNRYKQDVLNANNHTMHATNGTLTWTMQAADNILINPDLPKGDIEEHIAEYIWTTATRTGKHVISIYVRKPLI